jgi:hypothetical protein
MIFNSHLIRIHQCLSVLNSPGVALPYFPMQNWLNTASSKSSVVVLPTISPQGQAAPATSFRPMGFSNSQNDNTESEW